MLSCFYYLYLTYSAVFILKEMSHGSNVWLRIFSTHNLHVLERLTTPPTTLLQNA